MTVRAHVLEFLATPQADTRYHEAYLPAAIQRRSSCRPHEVWEALWGLVGEGLIYLDPAGQAGASSQDNWRWRLSSIGVTAAQGGSWEPRDPEGYLRRLRCDVPDVDPIVLRYVEEALGAFNARCYLAASVMLGVASEQAFLQLARTVTLALKAKPRSSPPRWTTRARPSTAGSASYESCLSLGARSFRTTSPTT